MVRKHRPDHTHFRPTQRAYIDTHTHSHIHPSTVHGSAGLPVAVIRHISAFTGDLQRCVEGLIHPPSWPGFLLQFPCWSLKHLTSEILVCFRSCLVVLVLCTLFPPSVSFTSGFRSKDSVTNGTLLCSSFFPGLVTFSQQNAVSSLFTNET